MHEDRCPKYNLDNGFTLLGTIWELPEPGGQLEQNNVRWLSSYWAEGEEVKQNPDTNVEQR